MSIQSTKTAKYNYTPFILAMTSVSTVGAGIYGYTRKIAVDKLKKETANDVYLKSSSIPSKDFKIDKIQNFIKYLPEDLRTKVYNEIKPIKLKKAGLYGVIGLVAGAASSLILSKLAEINVSPIPNNQVTQSNQDSLLLMNELNSINMLNNLNTANNLSTMRK